MFSLLLLEIHIFTATCFVCSFSHKILKVMVFNNLLLDHVGLPQVVIFSVHLVILLDG